jgi:hypothetical protein
VAQGICATEVQKGAPQKRYFLVVNLHRHRRSQPDTTTRAHLAIGDGRRPHMSHIEDVLHRHWQVSNGRCSKDTPAWPGPERSHKVPTATQLHVGRCRYPPDMHHIGPAGPERTMKLPPPCCSSKHVIIAANLVTNRSTVQLEAARPSPAHANPDRAQSA